MENRESNTKSILLQILKEQALDKSISTPQNMGSRFSGGVAKGQLENLLRDEERQRLRDTMYSPAKALSFDRNNNVYTGPYAEELAARDKAAYLGDLDIARKNKLEDAEILRRNSLEEDEIRRKARLTSLASAANPMGQDPALSVPDPFVSHAQLANTGIFDGQNSPYGNSLKLDATNPDHMAAAKAAIKEAIDSGKPIDQAGLMSSIQNKIQDVTISRLTNKSKISDLEKNITENTAKTNKALGNEDIKEPLSPKTKSAIEAAIMKTHQARIQFSVLQKQFRPEFFSRLNKFGVGTLQELEKADPNSLNSIQKRALGDYTAYRGSVGRAFDLYRKNITGASAAKQELDALEKNFLNMNMSATQFQTAIIGLDAFAQLDAISVRDLKDTNMDLDKLNELAVSNPRVEELLKKWKAAIDLVYDTEADNEVISDPSELAKAKEVLQRRLQQGSSNTVEAKPAEDSVIGANIKAAMSQGGRAPVRPGDDVSQMTKDNLSGKLPPSQVADMAAAAARRKKQAGY